MLLPSTSLILSSLVAVASIFAIASAADGDWISDWSGPERILDGSFDVDPLDSRSMMRGSGQITFGNDIAKFNGSPRLYISQEAGVEGWDNVEITAYGKYVHEGTPKSYSGLTIATRSNHDLYKDDPCDAFAYYARIYQETGECAFQKEYYHSSTAGTVYTPTKRVPCFEGGLPLDQWVGMKFKVTTTPGTSDVTLELYLDEHDDGNWLLYHSVVDTPGYWFSSSSKTVPSECPQNDGDTVIRPGNVSFLRTDGDDESTEVHWRHVSMINFLTGDPTCFTGILSNDACCSIECGECGGSGCYQRPGGAENCCAGDIQENTERTCDKYPPPCLVLSPDPTCSTGILSGDACCSMECGECGGPGCFERPGGAENCCVNDIEENTGRTCDMYPPPCLVVVEETTTTTTSTTEVPQVEDPDPACFTGIEGGNDVCCHSECGACGGSGCGDRPGGSQNCCTGSVSSTGRSCNDYPPPCVIASPDPTCATGIEGGNDACCPSMCGACGGSGCGDRPGGSQNCCTGSVSSSGRSCGDEPPPCVMA